MISKKQLSDISDSQKAVLEPDIDKFLSEFRLLPQGVFNEGFEPIDDSALFPPEAPPVTSCSVNVTKLSDIPAKEAEWLVTGYIPRYQITIFAGDGGSGKTWAWVKLAADLSAGRATFLEDIPFEKREPQRILYLSAEDSSEYILKKRLQENDADMERIYTVDLADDTFPRIKLNSEDFSSLIDTVRPDLCIIDPLQAFLPDRTNMSARSDMRNLLSPLISLGKTCGTTFLIVMHTNKLQNAWGRNRMSDSSDMWDIARAVHMVGSYKEPDGTVTRYISQEKCNYGPLQQTVLYQIRNNTLERTAFTDKKDRDFVLEAARNTSVSRAEENSSDIREWILSWLGDREHIMSDFEEAAENSGITKLQLKKCQRELEADGTISIRQIGRGRGKGKLFLIRTAGSPMMEREEAIALSEGDIYDPQLSIPLAG